MIKLVYCINKKPGLSDDEFFRYWTEVHGPIGAGIPGVGKLVQSRRIDVPGDKYPASFDGVAELWFEDLDSLLKARTSEEWMQSTADEANFIDHSRVAYLVTEERIVVDRA